MKRFIPLVLALAMPAAQAQWQLLDAHTTADLHGISSVGGGVAWASGSHGAILRTKDSGHLWEICVAPPDGADLNFRSIQGFDADTAVVMSSGKGELARVYKTTDGCHSWKQVFTNPNADGSFNTLHRVSAFQIFLLGDPVNGKFVIFKSEDAGNTWSAFQAPGLDAPADAEAFASGSGDFINVGFLMAFGTAGKRSEVYTFSPYCGSTGGKCTLTWTGKSSPLAQASSPVAGVFSLAGRTTMVRSNAPVTGIGTMPAVTLVAVGGNSREPAANTAAAAFSEDNGTTWKLSSTQPGGYRSGVDFDANADRFIAVGPNGTDVSNDDGLGWIALKPGPGDTPEADQHWSAISLPFVVGPHGRIGMLRAASASALQVGEQK